MNTERLFLLLITKRQTLLKSKLWKTVAEDLSRGQEGRNRALVVNQTRRETHYGKS